ncbi:hypothetical protein OYT13_15935 [Pandoraea sp. XJJ-1]|uniref:hypothetical protein n=1 Tax=Pandoraea sp. XJJ-1 TaxID=3002643 RepID=UPI002280DCD1|nr:hypothetical protein [Pandoraea sp. XJJ-1]WAL81341.1 hypothetical protein OYT13_15935 [Pandoraea sp. XJJ-1]
MSDHKTVTFDASQWQLVPKVPTGDMLIAGNNKKNYGISSDVYAAMLAAAPTPADASQWQPIETAPQGTMILCANMRATQAKDWAYVAWIADGKVCGHRADMPTHWMSLPSAPGSAPTPAAQSAGQEVVAYLVSDQSGPKSVWLRRENAAIDAAEQGVIEPLYRHAAPVNASEPVTWRGLTEREIDDFVERICDYGTGFVSPLDALVREIEAKLHERNAAPVNGGKPTAPSEKCPICVAWEASGKPLGSIGDPGQHHCVVPVNGGELHPDHVLVSKELLLKAAQAINWHLEPGSPDEHEAVFKRLVDIVNGGERAQAIEEAAQIADAFKCGTCGMDGKCAAAIRELKSQRAADAPQSNAINAELLEALEGMLAESVYLSDEYLAIFKDWPSDKTINGWDKARWLRASEAVKKARAALSKARGEQV